MLAMSSCTDITASVTLASRGVTSANLSRKGNQRHNTSMKSSEDIRAGNLEKLLLERADGSVTKFGKMANKDRTLISRWRPTSKNRKVISPETARAIEHELKLPPNWMDQDHTTIDTEDAAEQRRRLPGTVRVEEWHPDDGIPEGFISIPAVELQVGAGSRLAPSELK